MNEERRKPQFGEPDYDAAAFAEDVFGGRFRWAATLATIASALLVASRFLLATPPDIPFPHLTGTAATVAVVLLFLFWLSLAIMISRRAAPTRAQNQATTSKLHLSDRGDLTPRLGNNELETRRRAKRPRALDWGQAVGVSHNPLRTGLAWKYNNLHHRQRFGGAAGWRICGAGVPPARAAGPEYHTAAERGAAERGRRSLSEKSCVPFRLPQRISFSQRPFQSFLESTSHRSPSLMSRY
jgi:hypothetical protein